MIVMHFAAADRLGCTSGVPGITVSGVRTVLLLAILASCDPNPHNHRIASAITLAASTVATACDAGQTISAAHGGWQNDLHEGNWLLGSRPSVGSLAAYNSGVLAVNAGIWYALPPRYDWAIPLAMWMLEAVLVAQNSVLVPRPFCGIR